MELNFLVFDENTVIASFKYLDDAITFIYSLIPDPDSESFGYDIFDSKRAEVIDFKRIKKIFKNYKSIE